MTLYFPSLHVIHALNVLLPHCIVGNLLLPPILGFSFIATQWDLIPFCGMGVIHNQGLNQLQKTID